MTTIHVRPTRAALRVLLPFGRQSRAETFLDEQKVRIWSELPAWAPGDPLTYVSVSRAVAAGLTYRPFAVTAIDTLEWDKKRPAAERAKRAAGLPREKEATLLAEWKKRRG